MFFTLLGTVSGNLALTVKSLLLRVTRRSPHQFRDDIRIQKITHSEPPRVKRDQVLSGEVYQVWEDNFRVYGARKVWRQLQREGRDVARCTVERLMKRLGIQGVVRGAKRWTTVRDDTLSQPADRVKRQFTATRPNQL